MYQRPALSIYSGVVIYWPSIMNSLTILHDYRVDRNHLISQNFGNIFTKKMEKVNTTISFVGKKTVNTHASLTFRVVHYFLDLVMIAVDK